MSRSWWSGITPAGLISTVTSCLCSVGLTATACALFIRGDQDSGLALLAAAGFSAQGSSSLLARTRPDPAATVEAPASVSATPVGYEPEYEPQPGEL